MRPEFQISLGAELPQTYAEAVRAFGGVPHEEYLPEPDPEHHAGLILGGGADIAPARYGEDDTHCFGTDPARDEAEWALIEAYLRAGKPILGICRGLQVLNVFFGGTLCQHLETADRHVPTKQGDAAHDTTAAPGSFLAALYGERFPVNSAHHQGVLKLAADFSAVQWCGELVEGMAHRSLPIYAVQWHPERMCLSRSRPDTVDGGAIFRWFLSLCQQ